VPVQPDDLPSPVPSDDPPEIGPPSPITSGGPIGPEGGALRGGVPITTGLGLTPGLYQPPGLPVGSNAIGDLPFAQTGGNPVGGAESIFNIGGAPIAVLGGLLSGGLPIGGPVAQIFVGGAPTPNVLFLSTLTPSGPIGQFGIGLAGGPIGVDVFGGGGLPIGVPPATAIEITSFQARAVSTLLPEVSFNPERIGSGGSPIGFT
jgi:hypothetical protein